MQVVFKWLHLPWASIQLAVNYHTTSLWVSFWIQLYYILVLIVASTDSYHLAFSFRQSFSLPVQGSHHSNPFRSACGHQLSQLREVSKMKGNSVGYPLQSYIDQNNYRIVAKLLTSSYLLSFARSRVYNNRGRGEYPTLYTAAKHTKL